jgi:sugar lactone lactonase YvrE
MQEFVAKPCTTNRFYLGECCHWDEVRNELYWIDVATGRFFRAKADDTQIDIVCAYELDGYLTALAPVENRSDGWIVARNQSISFLDEVGVMHEAARPEAHNASVVRMNDGAADPWGRFWVGSMAFDAREDCGSLYRFHESSRAEPMFPNVTISNGLGWSPDGRTMYSVDGGPGTIHTFDVREGGEIFNKQLFFQFDTESDGAPMVFAWIVTALSG